MLRTAASERNEIDHRSQEGQVDEIKHVVDDTSGNKDDGQLGHKDARHTSDSGQNNGHRKDGEVLNMGLLDMYSALNN